MTRIREYVEQIDAELCDAKGYAEDYVECKAGGKMSNAQKYKEMSNDELKHAAWIHDMAVMEINHLEEYGIEPTVLMQNIWDDSHTKYVEKEAWIKQMLAM